MDFLKSLRRMFTSAPPSGDRGLYFYVKSRRSGEVIRVRIDPMNDLSADYDEQASGKRDRLTVHKMITGSKGYDRLEADFSFNLNKQLIEKTVTGGDFVTAEDYKNYLQNSDTLSN